LKKVQAELSNSGGQGGQPPQGGPPPPSPGGPPAIGPGTSNGVNMGNFGMAPGSQGGVVGRPPMAGENVGP